MKDYTGESKPSDLIILLLGAMGAIRTETRFVKMTFLCNKNLVGIKTYDDWRPHYFGPYSDKLENDKEELLSERFICDNKVTDRFSNMVTQYSLDIKGRKKFLGLLNKHEGMQFEIKKLLIDFQMEKTNYTLLKFVYKNYPDYTKNSKIKEQLLK